MYVINSVIIASVILTLMLVAMFVGGWLGRRSARETGEEERSQVLAVQGSLLGLLALLLGFTFSLALGRHDARSQAVVQEANAIGTVALRLDLLPDNVEADAKQLLSRYAIVREQTGLVSAANYDRRDELIAAAEEIFGKLWTLTAAEAEAWPNPVSMAVMASLNDMIDALGERDAAIERHVPETVLFLLFGTFILLGIVLGFGAAVSRIRPGPPVYAMVGLIVILVFLIIDLDRPRRGFIAVDQSPISAVAQAMQG